MLLLALVHKNKRKIRPLEIILLSIGSLVLNKP